MRRKPLLLAFCFGSALLQSSFTLSDVLSGIKTVSLIDGDQQKTEIATVTFSDAGDFKTFSIEMQEKSFSEHFLSMRPFKCIEGEKNWACHLPYPYESRGLINQDDLIDLEYALLFIAKTPAEFGIDAWNGRYYKLSTNNDAIEGVLHEADFNVLASPPEQKYLRPITHHDLTEADASTRRFPRLIIE